MNVLTIGLLSHTKNHVNRPIRACRRVCSHKFMLDLRPATGRPDGGSPHSLNRGDATAIRKIAQKSLSVVKVALSYRA
jgi:hypothetical protein